MSVLSKVQSLRGEISQTLAVLERLEAYFINFQETRLIKNQSTDEAMIVAQSLTNYYTCVETLFLRISQFFENGLEAERWHQSLLSKMVLEIPDIRPRVISNATHQSLSEILKFRHFTRYYFELNYDWDKLNFLIKKFNEVYNVLRNEIVIFDTWLLDLTKTNSTFARTNR